MKSAIYHIGDADCRPWGKWQVLDVMPNAVVKKIEVAPGKRISLQRHQHRSEHWVVVQGTATVQRDGKILHLKAGQSVDLPQTCMHRLANDTTEPVAIIEVQYGELLSEDDIERFDDDFGRTSA